MKRILITAALLAVTVATANANDAKIYRCKVADVVNVDDDGRLRPDNNPRHILRQLYDGVIVDTMTGAVTYPVSTSYPKSERTVWTIVQHGDHANDHVLIPRSALVVNPLSERDTQLRIATTDFIRIRDWSPQPTGKVALHFMAYSLSNMASGPCEVVR